MNDISGDLLKCPICHKTNWAEKSNRITYVKYINGARLQQSLCLYCSKKLHEKLTKENWLKSAAF